MLFETPNRASPYYIYSRGYTKGTHCYYGFQEQLYLVMITWIHSENTGEIQDPNEAVIIPLYQLEMTSKRIIRKGFIS